MGPRTRFDAIVFSTSRLKAKTKTTTLHVCEALYADDTAICAHSEEQLQSIIDSLSNTCSVFGLTISVRKTVIMGHGTQVAKITFNDEALETVENFSYLRSIMSNNFTHDKELNTRPGKAATCFGRLSKRVWSNENLTLHTKLKVYHTCVLSTLLYGAEAWTTYRKQELKRKKFHLRCLCTILCVKWQNKITNLEIIQCCNSTPLSSILKHGHRMPIDRLPKQIMYGGKRPVGRPKLRYKDVIKRDLKDYSIDPMHWQTVAEERPIWRTSLTGGSAIDIKQDLTRLPMNKLQMASGQGSHWLIKSPTIFSFMCNPPLSNICQFYFKTYSYYQH